jgi:hypothetical protein
LIQGHENHFFSENYVKITNYRSVDTELPDGYDMPIITSAKEFAKLKSLNRVSKYIEITFYKQKIEFFCDKENIYSKKITFGDSNLKGINENKKETKSFRVLHKCSQKKDRTTAGYWSCNLGRYSKQLGLSSSNY